MEAESVGLNDYIKDDKLMKRFNDELKCNRTRYCVKLPIREHHEILLNNFQNSETRLVKLLNSLNQDLLENYDKIIKTYEKENIIEKIETLGKPGVVDYLPHHTVMNNESDTTKTRTVLDASSKIGNNHFLNDRLHLGPCLLALIFDTLLRFRTGGVALVADIKQAFLNIEIDEGDRDFFTFLSVENISEKDKIVVCRFLKVVFGFTSSPFLLGATIKLNVTKYIVAQIAVVALKKSLQDMYVDDVVTSFYVMEKGAEFYFKKKNVSKKVGLNCGSGILIIK